MAQSEDTELRDLVVEALEKNGSLAKIRALLRANIFLAFEDDCENPKQNETLDKILNLPEGKVSLCIIHEFLEFCNLKNTLFVYMSESRQEQEYTYRKQDLLEKLNVPKINKDKEPILLTIIKNVLKSCHNKHAYSDNSIVKQKKDIENNLKDEQNCTYIVHEDTSTSSQSLSDNSSDERNKIDVRLPLDNSDTDTSSDSARDKKSSEYIPNKQNIYNEGNELSNTHVSSSVQRINSDKPYFGNGSNNNTNNSYQDLKNFSSSTESTSYIGLKSFHPFDELLLNTTGLPVGDNNAAVNIIQSLTHPSASISEPASPVHSSSSNLIKINKEASNKQSPIANLLQNANNDSGLNDMEVIEYSYDFSPTNSEHKTSSELKTKYSESIKDIVNNADMVSTNLDNSHSSISTADVIDLLSDRSYRSLSKDSKNDKNINRSRLNSTSNRSLNHIDNSKINNDNLSDFSESSIPSISNLSFENHSN